MLPRLLTFLGCEFVPSTTGRSLSNMPVFSAVLTWIVTLPSRSIKGLKTLIELSGERFKALLRWWRRPPRKQPPRLLTTPWLCIQLLIQAAIIITVGILWRRSRVHKGIATVRDSQQTYFDAHGLHPPSLWSSSIVWTTVPAWVISAYSAFWSAMLEMLIEVHRTLGLYKSELIPLPGSKFSKRAMGDSLGKLSFFRNRFQSVLCPSDTGERREAETAKRTIMLDYGSIPIVSSLKAMHYGHIILGLCMLLRAALWAAGGLSAAVFSVAAVPFQTSIALSSELFFDEYLGYNEGKGPNTSSSLTAMDVVSATLVNDGADYPWTTDTHSFLPFKTEPHLESGNYTADTESYWADMDCNIATLEDLLSINAIDLNYADEEDESAEVYLHYSYKDCDVLKYMAISNRSTQYGRSYAVTGCSLAAGQARFGMISGIFNTSEEYWLSNLTVITCQPLFYKSNVSVTVSLSNDSSMAQVLNFTETGQEPAWPFFVRRWLGDTPYYNVLDPSTVRDLDTFSRLVISHVSRDRTLDTSLPPAQLLDSFTTIFRAYYATFVTLQAYYPAVEPHAIQGTVSKEVSRLFVVDGPAWAVIGIMIVAFLVTVVLTCHMYRNQTTLLKHAEPMLGDALLFHKNRDMGHYLDELKETAGNESNAEKIDLVEYARKKELSNWVVWMEGDVFHIRQQGQGSANGNGTVMNNLHV